MQRLLLLLGFALAACGGDAPAPLADLATDTAEPTTISALDSLGEGSVSLNGRVADHAAGERTLVLDDGTGLVRIRLPETPPVLVGHRLFVRGQLRQSDDGPVLDAAEWLYDSTAISVHSD